MRLDYKTCILFPAVEDTIHCPLHLRVRRHLLIARCDVAVVEILQNFSHFSAPFQRHIIPVRCVNSQSWRAELSETYHLTATVHSGSFFLLYSGSVFKLYTWTFLIHRTVLRDLCATMHN